MGTPVSVLIIVYICTIHEEHVKKDFVNQLYARVHWVPIAQPYVQSMKNNWTKFYLDNVGAHAYNLFQVLDVVEPSTQPTAHNIHFGYSKKVSLLCSV
jgi:hypothetical protein